ncbi:response regulator transcription factor [Intrasporangium flavum]|uniref:response regulator transcription factor n=1 Tax=Intrasporangium flavum TaxID=1428657 RepID=UPI00096C1973|nr:response regulator transcription factor [Intrasporangium flavum]
MPTAPPPPSSSSDASTARGLVLVVEDEVTIADLLRLNLRAAGYGVEVVTDGGRALAAVRELRPSAIVLDIGLPTMDGIEVCRRLRAEGDWTPVLFVTARDDEVDRVLGLELGADDYVTKPFSPRELVARVGGVLRRTRGTAGASTTLRHGALRIDLTSHEVTVDGHEIALTATEFDLLTHLLRRPGVVFTREQLLSDVWGYASTAGGRTVDVHVAQVRAKLGDASPIRTVRSVGYAAERPPVDGAPDASGAPGDAS